MALGAAAAMVLGRGDGVGDGSAGGGPAPEVVVGRDPRISGDILESALVAGLCALGVHVTALGVVPTPGVAFVTRARGARAGVVISASHNPVRDNGIKFFGPDGRKLADAIEAEIEARIEDWESRPRPAGADVGRLSRLEDPIEAYAAHLRATCPGGLEGLRLVADCANGAASALGPRVLRELGASVVSLSATPNGVNINENCGSLHPEAMAARVVAEGADAGLAFDGDADRVILADGRGRIVDGDRVLCMAGIHLARGGRLPGGVVVGTVMSNLGLEQALARHDLRLVRAAVGDRYVAEEMQRWGAALGGEKSGHLLFAEHASTGDGILTALQVLRICRESGRTLAEWADEMEELPQVLKNVRVVRREGWRDVPAVAAALERAEARLQGRGRIFVRPSGTEKLIRVMAEGPDLAEVQTLVDEVADALQVHLGI
jgi:phosphoglucosamine mutase